MEEEEEKEERKRHITNVNITREVETDQGSSDVTDETSGICCGSSPELPAHVICPPPVM